MHGGTDTDISIPRNIIFMTFFYPGKRLMYPYLKYSVSSYEFLME
jgi:hypothetical protein